MVSVGPGAKGPAPRGLLSNRLRVLCIECWRTDRFGRHNLRLLKDFRFRYNGCLWLCTSS